MRGHLRGPGLASRASGTRDTDGFPREFVAKVIVVDPYASEPPACRGADYVWAAKDELDHAIEATRVSYAPPVLTQCERRLGRGAS